MNKREALLENLKVLVSDAEKQAKHLELSYRKCSAFELKTGIDSLSESELESLEALVSRFGRLSDILIQKIYRSIDEIELERSGTVIDRLNAAEKRELIDSAEEFRRIRETRNDIEHEYVSTGLFDLYVRTLEYIPKLLEATAKLAPYLKTVKP